VRATLLALSVLMAATPNQTAAQQATQEAALLVVGILRVRSSYSNNVEAPADGRPDTIQWFIGSGQTWRVRTYATDHDIHVHATGTLPGEPVQTATDHIRKHYTDVLDTVLVVPLPLGTTASSARPLLGAAGLGGELEVARAGFAFLNPDGGEYRTKSAPK
jgi:hypothetical protein